MSPTSLEQITSATEGTYDVVAELGESSAGLAVMAQELDGGALVVLLLPPAADEIVVLPTIGDRVPATAGACTACGTTLSNWSVTCPHCSHQLVGELDDRFTDADLEATIAPAYDFLGRMVHEVTGGTLIFARDRVDHRLVALTLGHSPSGEHVLEAVWESRHATLGTVPTAAATPTGAAYPRPAATAPDLATDWSGPAPPAPSGTDGSPAFGQSPRRRWVPIVAIGVVALVAAGAWLAWQGTVTRTAPVVPIATVPVAPTTAVGVVAATDSTAATLTVAAGSADSVRRAQQAALPTIVVIDGELPTDWTRTVNGRSQSSNRSVMLRFGTSALIRIEAPGYCADTFRVALAPGTTQHWTPNMRGVPMVGGC